MGSRSQGGLVPVYFHSDPGYKPRLEPAHLPGALNGWACTNRDATGAPYHVLVLICARLPVARPFRRSASLDQSVCGCARILARLGAQRSPERHHGLIVAASWQASLLQFKIGPKRRGGRMTAVNDRDTSSPIGSRVESDDSGLQKYTASLAPRRYTVRLPRCKPWRHGH